jgi:hypothetical protein
VLQRVQVMCRVHDLTVIGTSEGIPERHGSMDS